MSIIEQIFSLFWPQGPTDSVQPEEAFSFSKPGQKMDSTLVTLEQLQAIMPRLPLEKAKVILPSLLAALQEFEITAPLQIAAFLAQVAHETYQLKYQEEIWGPTDAQKRYEPVTTLSKTLGNVNPGDGYLFKGRGWFQLTGRANYKKYGVILKIDLERDPKLAGTPEVASRVAGLYWKTKGLGPLAENNDELSFREITRRINGGFNGLAERENYWKKAKEVLGC